LNRLIACYNIFNEEQFLDRSIRSVWDVMDEFIFVDGAYKGYVNDTPASSDGTLNIVEKWMGEGKPCTLIEAPRRFWPDQVTKRQEYLRRVMPGDWVCLMDGDWIGAWLGGAKEMLAERTDVDAWKPAFLKYGRGGRLFETFWGNPHIIRKTAGMHYKWNHYTILDAEGRNTSFPPYTVETTRMIQIYHARNERRPERAAHHLEWAKNRRILYANERERFDCGCGYRDFHLPEGAIQVCPRCGSHLLGAFIENIVVG